MGHFTHSGWIKFFIAILLQAIGLITLLLSTLIVSHLQICLVAPGGVTLIHMVLESLPYLQFKRDELRESQLRQREKKIEQFYTSKNKTFDRILCLHQPPLWFHPHT